MRKLIATLVVGALPLMVFGQATVTWFTSTPMLDYQTNAVQSSFADPLSGCLVQLIRTVGTSKVSPVTSGDGVSGTDVLVAWTYCSNGSTPGTFAEFQNLGGANPLSSSSNMYVRVWDRPTSGSGALPAVRTIAGFGDGWMYVDGTVHTPTGADPDFFYDLGTINGSSAWTFLAIPEPTSMALGLLGLGVIVIRRRLMRK